MKSQSLSEEVQDLLYQALETELGGVKVYETALECAVNPELTACGKNDVSADQRSSRERYQGCSVSRSFH